MTDPVFTPSSHAHIPHVAESTPSRPISVAGRLLTTFAAPAAMPTVPANASGASTVARRCVADAGTTRAASSPTSATPAAVSNGTLLHGSARVTMASTRSATNATTHGSMPHSPPNTKPTSSPATTHEPIVNARRSTAPPIPAASAFGARRRNTTQPTTQAASPGAARCVTTSATERSSRSVTISVVRFDTGRNDDAKAAVNSGIEGERERIVATASRHAHEQRRQEDHGRVEIQDGGRHARQRPQDTDPHAGAATLDHRGDGFEVAQPIEQFGEWDADTEEEEGGHHVAHLVERVVHNGGGGAVIEPTSYERVASLFD